MIVLSTESVTPTMEFASNFYYIKIHILIL
jgi:hypothetical protein